MEKFSNLKINPETANNNPDYVSGSEKKSNESDVETKGHELVEENISEDYNEKTLEEIEEDFEKAKKEFISLTEWNLVENENITAGRNILKLSEDNAETDKTIIKNCKEKYLKGLLLCIEEIKNKESDQLSKVEDYNLKNNSLQNGFKVNFEKSNGEKVIGEVKSWTNGEVVLGFKDGEIVSVPIGKYYTLPIADKEEVSVKSNENESYEKARTQLLNLKKDYQTKKAEYDQVLDDFYKNKSFLTKTAEFLGFKPNLPPDLINLESQYKNLKAEYANNLNSTLEKRSRLTYEGTDKSEIQNKNYESTAETTKIAFAEKFILKPNEQLLRRQEEFALSESQKSQMGRILGTLGQHKWFVRFGAVTLAGLAGAATGGLAAFAAGAGVQASRILAGTIAGGLAGNAVRKFTQGSVNQAIKNVDDTKKNILKSFSIDDLDKLEDELFEAQYIRDERIKAQKVASIASAVLSGGAISGGIGMWSGGGELTENISESLRKNTSTMADLMDAKPAPAPAVEKTSEILDVDTDIYELAISNEINVKNINLEGRGGFVDIKIKGVGLVGEHEDLTEIPNDKIGLIEKEIKLKAGDLLAENQNLPKANLEKEVFNHLGKKFGEDNWWIQSDIKGVSLNILEKVDHPAKVETGALETKEIPEVLDEKKDVEEIYTYIVNKGDSLWNITEQFFAEDLKGLSESEKNQVIAKLMEKTEQDKNLLKSLNIKSNDIDLIYPNETLNLNKFHDELLKIINTNTENTSGVKPINLRVNAENSGVEKVHINFGKEEVDLQKVEPVEFSNKIAKATFGAHVPFYVTDTENTTNFSEDNRAVNSVEKNTGKAIDKETLVFQDRDYEKRLDVAVRNLEKDGYDFFFSPRENYQSPYDLMKDMTMKEIMDLRDMDNSDLRQLLKNQDVKYEVYKLWTEEIDKIRSDSKIYNENLTLEEQFKEYLLKRKV